MMIKVGDRVTRLLGGVGGVPMSLPVTEVTDDKLICGLWTFCKTTGAEIDDDLDWGPPPKHTGSYLKELQKETNAKADNVPDSSTPSGRKTTDAE